MGKEISFYPFFEEKDISCSSFFEDQEVPSFFKEKEIVSCLFLRGRRYCVVASDTVRIRK